MLRRPTICAIYGLFILLAGLAVAQEPLPPSVLNPAERARSQARRRAGNMDPSLTSVPPPPAPVPTPFTPPPATISPSAPPQATPPLPQPVGPSVPPVVTFRDGLLTVQALNSTLGSVMIAIRNKTGIEFEGGEGSLDLVAISLGPAPEGEVLAAIFGGSSFDFVALGRPDSPGIVQRVILKPNSKIGGPTGSASPTMQPRTPRVVQDGDEEENVPEEQVNSNPSGVEQPQDMPIQPPPTAQVQPKSPEQLLQEMQEMRRQRQQQQQQPEEDNSHSPRKQPPL